MEGEVVDRKVVDAAIVAYGARLEVESLIYQNSGGGHWRLVHLVVGREEGERGFG